MNALEREMELLQKKAALERLEVAVNTFDDEACFLKLSDDGNTVTIHFIGGGTKTVNVRGDSGIAMLCDVLEHGFFEYRSERQTIAKTIGKKKRSEKIMDKKLKEKLLDSGFTQKAAERTSEFVKELFLKDTRYAADILGFQIDENGEMTFTKTEHAQFLALMYGILTCQEHKIKEIKALMLADIKKRNSKLAEKLTGLKLSREE